MLSELDARGGRAQPLPRSAAPTRLTLARP
jgi:hypothetical protein